MVWFRCRRGAWLDQQFWLVAANSIHPNGAQTGDHSGPLLGLVLYGAAVKLFLLSALVLHLLLPVTLGRPALDWLLFVAGMLALAVGIGVVESMMARLRLRYVPSLLVASAVVCVFAFVLTLAA